MDLTNEEKEFLIKLLKENIMLTIDGAEGDVNRILGNFKHLSLSHCILQKIKKR